MPKVDKTIISPSISSTPSVEGKVPTKTSSAVPPAKIPEDGFAKAVGGLLSYKSSPLFSGAIKILSESGGMLPDNVLIPGHLLNPNDPRNNPKYLRLLAAIFGMDELESYFYSLEGEKQAEYLDRKAKQREAKLAKKEKEKQEKKLNHKDDDDET